MERKYIFLFAAFIMLTNFVLELLRKWYILLLAIIAHIFLRNIPSPVSISLILLMIWFASAIITLWWIRRVGKRMGVTTIGTIKQAFEEADKRAEATSVQIDEDEPEV